MFDCYDHCTSGEAKTLYFLDTKDLANLPYESESLGFGCGRPTKWYKLDILEQVAVAKHGAAGLAKKRDQRKKRQENQRQKELAARQAREALLKSPPQAVAAAVNNENVTPNPPTASTTTTTATTAKPVVTPTAKTVTATTTSAKDLKKLRQDIVKAYKPLITWDYLNTKRAPNGCSVTAHIPRVSAADYAALIGRPTDTSLQSVVKKGAYYSVEDLEFSSVMGNDHGIPGKGGRYGCNRQLGLDPSFPLTVKFKPSDGSLSVTGFVRHVDTFGFD